MGIFASLLRRLGYVRLRNYNLRTLADGTLVPINSQQPVPIDFGGRQTSPVRGPAFPPKLVSAPANQLWPQIPQLTSPPAFPEGPIAEGTADGLKPVVKQQVKQQVDTKPIRPLPRPGRRRSSSDTIPEPAPAPLAFRPSGDE